MRLSSEQAQALQQVVNEATGHDALCADIERLYAAIEAELDRLKPRCEMSGRCCRFEAYGHRLFVTSAELTLFVRQARMTPSLSPFIPCEDGEGCRFQQGKLCQAHTIRPMGCRLFFCDPAAEPQLQLLYEKLHTQLRLLHDQHQVPYYYVEWREGLKAIQELLLPT